MRKNRDIRSIEKTAVLKGAAVFVFLLIYKVYCKIIIIIAL